MRMCGGVSSKKNAHKSVCLSLVHPASGLAYQVLCIVFRVSSCTQKCVILNFILDCTHIYPSKRNFSSYNITCNFFCGRRWNWRSQEFNLRSADTPKSRFVHGFNHRGSGLPEPGNYFGEGERHWDEIELSYWLGGLHIWRHKLPLMCSVILVFQSTPSSEIMVEELRESLF